MKSVLVVGLGRFGRHLAGKMQELGNAVMVVDEDSELVNKLSSKFPDSMIGDCTNEGVVRALGVHSFDICFVCIGEDFQSSLVITSLFKRFNAKCVIAKANQDIQADLLKKIGADEIVYPEREMAEKLAIRSNEKNIFDYIPLTSEYAIYEIAVPSEWFKKTIIEVDVRKKYNINIIAVRNESQMSPTPSPSYEFKNGDHIILIGKSGDVFKLASHS